MKLRIRDNSIRLRLTKSEIQSLQDVGRVAAKTDFPAGDAFEYILRLDERCESSTATLSARSIEIVLPDIAARDWAASDEVSFRGEQAVEGGDLTLLVEKDFACLSPRDDEEESDMFEHPEAGQGNC